MKFRVIWAIAVLGIVLLGCKQDDILQTHWEGNSKVSFLSDSSFVQKEHEIATVWLSLNKPAQKNGEVILTVEGDATYGTDYSTIPEQVNDRLNIEVQKGDSLLSFQIKSMGQLPKYATPVSLRISNVSEGFEKGAVTTHTLLLPAEHHQETIGEINFSDVFIHVSENEPAPVQINLDITGTVKQSDRVSILIEAPVEIGYGSRYRTLPDAILHEIILEVLPGAKQIHFSLDPVNDQLVKGNYELTFRLVGSSQIKAGAHSQLQIRVEEDDQANSNLHSISDLKSKFEEHGNNFWIADDYLIEGVITSDHNVPDLKHAYIQDDTGGILLRFIVDKKVSLGDHVRLNLKGATGGIINKQKGIYGIKDLSGVIIRRNVRVAPLVITIDQLHSGNYEGRKVQVNDLHFVDVKAGATFLGNRVVKGVTSGAVVSTSQYAPFANTLLPGGTGSITGIVGDWGYLMPQVLKTDILF